jgi:hypothetical protein
MTILRTIQCAAVCVPAFAGVVFGVGLSAAGFYSPGMTVGDVSKVNDVGAVGFEGRVSLGDGTGFTPTLTCGYHEYAYNSWEYLYDIVGPGFVNSIPIIRLALGADYRFAVGRWRPYGGGGAVFAVEAMDVETKTIYERVPGLYVGGGSQYSLSERWAVEAGSRFTYLFDNPIVYYNWYNPRKDWKDVAVKRYDERSQLVDFLVGINYAF